MAKFLIRDDSTLLGSREINGPLSRNRQLSYVPWAIARDGRVVYAPTGQHRNRPNRGGMKPYDTLVSQERRRRCQSAMGSIALENASLTRGAVATVGIVPEGVGQRLPAVQPRNRGVDMFRRTVPHYTPQTPIPSTARAEVSGVSYYRDLDTRNELFGAGPSGTTGTLIAAGIAFGRLSGESLRQYLFAIVGYLVGGGMHSLHESLTVMGLIGSKHGIVYSAGSLSGFEKKSDILSVVKPGVFPTLPQSFLRSQQFASWRDTYYDIVVLGGTHWMFNSR